MMAEAGMLLWMGLLVLVGFIGFFAMAVVLMLRLVGFVFRSVLGIGPEEPEGEAAEPAALRCPHAGCGRGNPPGARFCGHCGRALGGGVDAYG